MPIFILVSTLLVSLPAQLPARYMYVAGRFLYLGPTMSLSTALELIILLIN